MYIVIRHHMKQWRNLNLYRNILHLFQIVLHIFTTIIFLPYKAYSAGISSMADHQHTEYLKSQFQFFYSLSLIILHITLKQIMQKQNTSLRQKLLNQNVNNQNDDDDEVQTMEKKLQELKKIEDENQSDENDSDEQQKQRIRKQLDSIKKQLKEMKKLRKANNKVVVGTGFGFDITEFFKFKKKKQLQSKIQGKSVFEQISGSHLSWVILMYSVCNAAIIPSWIMSIQASKFLRISWRFLLQTFMIIPFVLYERRIADAETKQKYTLKYIFTIQHIKKAYISAFATSFWFTVVLTTFEWTYISHAMVLGALPNFFLSIGRTSRSNGHDLQPGGQLLIFAGIILILFDSYTLRVEEISPDSWNYINYFLFTRNKYQRIAGDLAALTVSYIMSKFSIMTADLKNHYPPYLSMLLVNILISVNMSFSAYFFNGATYDFQSAWGLLSIFSQKHFAGFLYMSIILCMGLVISFVMISKLFPNPIVPGLAMTFEPSIATFFVQITGVQCMPGPFAFIGYVFIIPGNFLILIGQWMFQRSHKKEEVQEKKRLTELIILEQEKQKSLRSKNKSIQLKDLSDRSSLQLGSPKKMKKKQTYNQKYHKITNIGAGIQRANTLPYITNDEEQREVIEDFQCDMKKKDNFQSVESPLAQSNKKEQI